MRASLAAAAPKTVLVAEAWAPVDVQARYWGEGDEVQLAFSFDLAEALKTAAATGDAAPVINMLARSEALFAGKDRGFEAPFLSNHDQVRVMRALANNRGPARIAAAALFAMPGTPFVYYGEELGMLGGAGNADENKRTAFRWTPTAPGFGFSTGTPWRAFDEEPGVDVASQQADPGSLWHLYRKLIGLRRMRPELHAGQGAWQRVTGDGSTGVLALLRTASSGDKLLFVGNFGAGATGTLTIDTAGNPHTVLAEGLDGSPSAQSGKIAIPALSGRGFVFAALN
jgi:glycosidase